MKPSLDCSIELGDVSKVYHMGTVDVPALRGVNLTIPAGQFVVVLGPSGSGKTTLLNLIGGIDTPTSGWVKVGAETIQDYDERQMTEYRRRYIGFIFQSFNLFPTLTALENVEFIAELGSKHRNSHAPLDASGALTAVGLADRLHHFPTELSGGEQQRVAIARALVKDPPIVLADEPTGELDAATGVQILTLLRQVNRESGKTVLMVTHNAAIARVSDRVIHVRSGQIVEDYPVTAPVEPDVLEW